MFCSDLSKSNYHLTDIKHKLFQVHKRVLPTNLLCTASISERIMANAVGTSVSQYASLAFLFYAGKDLSM